MSDVGRLFAENLVRYRKRTGLSQEDAAVRASIHRTEWGTLERGARCPRIDTLVKLAGALGVTPNDLLEGINWTPGKALGGQFIETEVPGLGTVHRRFEVSGDSTRPSKEPSDTRSRMAEPAEAGSEAKN